ncbi:hypothetical protein SDJN02_13058, partial [Cucurbita argyrosperma subsp. argyrosperma]
MLICCHQLHVLLQNMASANFGSWATLEQATIFGYFSRFAFVESMKVLVTGTSLGRVLHLRFFIRRPSLRLARPMDMLPMINRYY